MKESETIQWPKPWQLIVAVSLLFLMFNRHPILPIDIKHDLIDNNADKEPESIPYDITFQAVFESAALIRKATNEKARISKRFKLSIKRTITIATAQYQQHCLLDPKCSC